MQRIFKNECNSVVTIIKKDYTNLTIKPGGILQFPEKLVLKYPKCVKVYTLDEYEKIKKTIKEETKVEAKTEEVEELVTEEETKVETKTEEVEELVTEEETKVETKTEEVEKPATKKTRGRRKNSKESK